MSVATPELDRRRAARLLLLAAIVAILSAVKFSYLPGSGPFGTDGALYVNAARNVQEGLGVQTNVSLYHSGLTKLPTRSAILYPLWPLLLGSSARILGLFPAVNVLPSLFYVLDLLLLYVLVNRLGAAGDAIFTPGHLLVAMFGLNVQFFGTTTFPYTEGLGFFCVLGALILFDRAVSARPMLYGALAGVACGLALLTRTQLVIAGVALVLTAIWVSVCDRRFLAAAAAFLAADGAFAAYWYFFVRGVTGSPSVPLPSLVVWSQSSGIAAYLSDRLEGIAVSFSPWSPYSYFACFGAAFLLPIVAAPLALIRWRRSATRRFCPRPESALAVACVLIALGTYASLNVYHHVPGFLVPWLFGYRHALPMIFGMAPAAVFLWNAGRGLRVFALACGAIAIAMGMLAVVDLVTAPRAHSPTAEEAQLIAWLERQQPAPVAITARAQHLSAYTHASLHWTECRTSAETTRVMLERLPIDSVIVYPDEHRCPFVRGLGDVLVERAGFGTGANRITVLGRRAR